MVARWWRDGGGERGHRPRMCRVGERDNINSRYANSSRAVRGNVNGEVPVIAIVPRRTGSAN